MPTANFLIIKAVIDNTTPPLQAIHVYHQGDPTLPTLSTRTLWPHVLGTNNGKEMVFCYQYDGYSKVPLKPNFSKKNFRCFEVSKLYGPLGPTDLYVKPIPFTAINPPPPTGQPPWEPDEFKVKQVKRQNCVDEDEVETFR